VKGFDFEFKEALAAFKNAAERTVRNGERFYCELVRT